MPKTTNAHCLFERVKGQNALIPMQYLAFSFICEKAIDARKKIENFIGIGE